MGFQVRLVLVYHLGLLLAFLPACNEDRKPASPLAEFQELLGKAEDSSATSEEGHRFIELLEKNETVRQWVAAQYSGLDDHKKNAILIAIRNVAPRATFPDFSILVEAEASSAMTVRPFLAIQCLRFYDTENRKNILFTRIQNHRTSKISEYELTVSVDIYLAEYGLSSVEAILPELMDHPLPTVCVRVSTSVAVHGNAEWRARAFSTIEEALSKGFASSEPYGTEAFIRALLDSDTRPPEPILKRITAFSERNVDVIAETAAEAVARWK